MSLSSKTNETVHHNLIELLTPKETEPGPLSVSSEDNRTTNNRTTNELMERLLSLCWLEHTVHQSTVVRTLAETIKMYRPLGPLETSESLLYEDGRRPPRDQ